MILEMFGHKNRILLSYVFSYLFYVFCIMEIKYNTIIYLRFKMVKEKCLIKIKN